MIALTWREKKPIISKELLEPYITTMNKRASYTDKFSVLLPIIVYEHFKNVGVNAKLTIIPCTKVIPYTNVGIAGMVWVKVEKLKKDKQ
jgi:hypothetical protein